MAKKRRKSRKHRTGVIVLKKLSGRGVGSLKDPKSAIGAVFPPLLGGALAAGGAIGIKMLAEPAPGEMQTETQLFLAEWAPWLGVGVGAIGALGLFAMVGAPQGVSAAAGAVAVGGALGMTKLLESSSTTAGRRRLYGVGATVPQRSPMTGAIVMSPAVSGRRRQLAGNQASGPSAGSVVSLQGINAVNTSAFGTPGFRQ